MCQNVSEGYTDYIVNNLYNCSEIILRNINSYDYVKRNHFEVAIGRENNLEKHIFCDIG